MLIQPCYIRFEYDLSYKGGNYDGVGEYALVPLNLCEHVGFEQAFREHTGHSRQHIVHYSENEYYDAFGNLLEDDIKVK